MHGFWSEAYFAGKGLCFQNRVPLVYSAYGLGLTVEGLGSTVQGLLELTVEALGSTGQGLG